MRKRDRNVEYLGKKKDFEMLGKANVERLARILLRSAPHLQQESHGKSCAIITGHHAQRVACPGDREDSVGR